MKLYQEEKICLNESFPVIGNRIKSGILFKLYRIEFDTIKDYVCKLFNIQLIIHLM